MKKTVTFERKKLLGILEKLRPGLAQEDTVEQATSFIFKDGFIWSFNDEIAVSHPLPKDIEFSGAVPAEPLLKLLAKCGKDQIQLISNETELLVSSGKLQAGITLEDAKLPVEKIPMPEDDGWLTVPKDFTDKLHLAALSAERSRSTQILSSIKITDKCALGCDNFQLTVAMFTKKIKGLKSVLLQARMVPDVVSFLPDAIAQCEGWIHFVNKNDVVLSCRAGEGEYPDVMGLLDVDGKTVKLPTELSVSLERAGIFTSTNEEENKVTLILEKSGALQVTAKNENGWLKETLKVVGKQTEFQLAIDPEILRSALKLDQTFVVGESAILIKGDEFKHVISLL